MLLSEIGDKEIVDLTKGSRHGSFWDAELIFDGKTGKIESLTAPGFELSWDSIVKIGEDLIIFRS
ncbi:MAG: YlmC/YmxH family sporulation protein [Firmicutes bacterium]|nr:YlmC/YmxH family sporulation protein [Bacillota bacterium]